MSLRGDQSTFRDAAAIKQLKKKNKSEGKEKVLSSFFLSQHNNTESVIGLIFFFFLLKTFATYNPHFSYFSGFFCVYSPMLDQLIERQSSASVGGNTKNAG